MKFQKRYPEAQVGDYFECEYSSVAKVTSVKECQNCGSMTKWVDVPFQIGVCSEECHGKLWKRHKRDMVKDSAEDDKAYETWREACKTELKIAEAAESVPVDILVVVKDQLEYFKKCVESVQEYTDWYHLYIWDNDSGQETKDYIDEILLADGGESISVITSEDNIGFNIPNNRLAEKGLGEYIILLNSDCQVFQGWSEAMTGFLDEHPDVAEVGYRGALLGPDGRGFGGAYGYEIDYIPGWCFCIKRECYEEHGLFDEKNLKFAYCEDADLSLRLKEFGHKLYAIHVPLVHHYQNKTIAAIQEEGNIDVQATFDHNHEYMSKRWASYLAKDRVLLKQGKEADEEVQSENPSG